jgi:hypothetical protein
MMASGRKSVELAIFHPKHIARQMKCIDLPTPIWKKFVGSNGSACYLVNVFGWFSFAEYLHKLRIVKVATHEPMTG